MTATGNPYEYVGYIKGYHYGSSVNYYVFGADQSGHRYSQPSFGALEPHHFQIEEGPATFEQSFELPAGWTWWSTNLDITLAQLETALGDKGISISDQNGHSVTYHPEYGWGGDLTAIEVGKMYEINTNSTCTITVNGSIADPAMCPITLNPGTNWIGFVGNESLSLDEAFTNFTPTNLDNIKTQNGSVTYYQNYGWRGNISTLDPGKGYIYKSKASSSNTFVFPSNGK